MSQTEHLSADVHKGRLLQTLHSKFLEIAVGPHVVVSLEEIHIHALVHQVGNGAEHPDITLGNNIAVLVPEIPDVAQEIQRSRILGKRPQKIHKTRLPGSRIIDLQTQMDVGDEIYAFTAHYANMNIAAAARRQ